MVPMSAEDFSRRKRQIVFKWLGAALLVILVGVWLYQRSTASQDSRKTLSDGEQMLEAGRYTEAIQSLDRAVAAESDLANAYLLRGRANEALNQTEPAIRDFTKVIQLQPGNSQAFVERASVHLANNNYTAAVADCGEAISRDPKLAYAYSLRGMACAEWVTSPSRWRISTAPWNSPPGWTRTFSARPRISPWASNTKAIADLDQVIALFPTSPMGYLARAKSREAIGDAAGARSDREIARQLEERAPGQ